MDEIYDVVIIGSGPAGLTAGIYCGRANLKTLVIGGEKWGGQLMLTTEVENFPGFPKGILGPDLMHAMRDQSERFGGAVAEENVTDVDFSKMPFEICVGEKIYKSRAVIIATGAAAKWLELPGEQRLIGRGVSSCAPCDAPFFKDRPVVVVGGGDAAMEEALTLTKFASGVTIVHRKGEFRASKIMQERVLSNPKIKVIWKTEVVDILGENKVIGIRLKTPIRQAQGGQDSRINIGEFGGKEISRTDSELQWEMPIEGVFVAIGHTPATKVFEGRIDLDEKGHVRRVTNDKYQMTNEVGEVIGDKYPSMSNVEGVFVSGDVHDFHYRQAVTAAGFGCMAAMDASRWLEEKGIGKGAATR